MLESNGFDELRAFLSLCFTDFDLYVELRRIEDMFFYCTEIRSGANGINILFGKIGRELYIDPNGFDHLCVRIPFCAENDPRILCGELALQHKVQHIDTCAGSYGCQEKIKGSRCRAFTAPFFWLVCLDGKALVLCIDPFPPGEAYNHIHFFPLKYT